MRLEDLTVEVRDKNLKRIGQVRHEDLLLEVDAVFNNVGAWTLKLSLEHPLTPTLRIPGSGIIITGPNDVMMSGPMVDWKFAGSASDPVGSIVFEGVSDEIHLADRTCWPEPGNADPANQTLAHDERTGNAEALLHAFTNVNAGPGALAMRRTSGLVMGGNGNRGPILTKAARFQYLGEWLSDIAVLGDLGFRVVQRGNQLAFETFSVEDRSLNIRLDVFNGTLSTQEVTITAPTATQVLVAGQGDLTERQFYAATNDAATQAEKDWGRRIERFLDQRQTDDSTEHVQAANEVLTKEGLTGVTVRLVPTDDATMRFAHDWFLGDRVAVAYLGGEVSAPVTGYKLLSDDQGTRLGVILGDATVFDRRAAQTAALAKRISVLERN